MDKDSRQREEVVRPPMRLVRDAPDGSPDANMPEATAPMLDEADPTAIPDDDPVDVVTEPPLPGPPLVDDKTTVAQFEKAVRENTRRLLAIARGIVGNRTSPEDVVQQAVMNLFQHRARYDWREPGGLLRRAVVNEALRILRQPRMAAVDDDFYADKHTESSSPADGMMTRETVAKVRQAIDRLPPNFRAALVLCEYEQMPYAQIATTLDASVPQIKTWIFRARRQLADMLKSM